ncbi:hypothetical protein E4U43_003635 [Claviceps pusilla]|uniref:Uncharacterized protein n=1 Tax=Claviceps pusilla TaxID=123648 RepID=A0A9P7SWM5_9HYPO|nr:hypothetical protein E4U43_003635 [Claviceps pusilla]
MSIKLASLQTRELRARTYTSGLVANRTRSDSSASHASPFSLATTEPISNIREQSAHCKARADTQVQDDFDALNRALANPVPMLECQVEAIQQQLLRLWDTRPISFPSSQPHALGALICLKRGWDNCKINPSYGELARRRKAHISESCQLCPAGLVIPFVLL